MVIKLHDNEEVSEEDFGLHKEKRPLSPKTLISELFNTEGEALEVVVDGRHYIQLNCFV